SQVVGPTVAAIVVSRAAEAAVIGSTVAFALFSVVSLTICLALCSRRYSFFSTFVGCALSLAAAAVGIGVLTFMRQALPTSDESMLRVLLSGEPHRDLSIAVGLTLGLAVLPYGIVAGGLLRSMTKFVLQLTSRAYRDRLGISIAVCGIAFSLCA